MPATHHNPAWVSIKDIATATSKPATSRTRVPAVSISGSVASASMLIGNPSTPISFQLRPDDDDRRRRVRVRPDSSLAPRARLESFESFDSAGSLGTRSLSFVASGVVEFGFSDSGSVFAVSRIRVGFCAGSDGGVGVVGVTFAVRLKCLRYRRRALVGPWEPVLAPRLNLALVNRLVEAHVRFQRHCSLERPKGSGNAHILRQSLPIYSRHRPSPPCHNSHIGFEKPGPKFRLPLLKLTYLRPNDVRSRTPPTRHAHPNSIFTWNNLGSK
jgi:hypothetical protein